MKKILAIAILCAFAISVFALIAIDLGVMAALGVYATTAVVGGAIIWAVKQL